MVPNTESYHAQSQLLADPTPKSELMAGVSVDCVILGFEEEKLKVLLIQHNGGPKDGCWALPGDFVNNNCNLGEMPYEVLHRLTGIQDIFVNQLGAFGNLERVDYRRIITVAYYALISPQKYVLKIGAGAKDVKWFEMHEVPKLIFDHKEILDAAIQKLRRDINIFPIGFELLADKFTLTQVQKLYEAILGGKLDTRNFRRKIIKSNMLIDTGKVDHSVPYRAPKLFRFNKDFDLASINNSFSFQI